MVTTGQSWHILLSKKEPLNLKDQLKSNKLLLFRNCMTQYVIDNIFYSLEQVSLVFIAAEFVSM